jgi:hypothetical protein
MQSAPGVICLRIWWMIMIMRLLWFPHRKDVDEPMMCSGRLQHTFLVICDVREKISFVSAFGKDIVEWVFVWGYLDVEKW